MRRLAFALLVVLAVPVAEAGACSCAPLAPAERLEAADAAAERLAFARGVAYAAQRGGTLTAQPLTGGTAEVFATADGEVRALVALERPLASAAACPQPARGTSRADS